MTKITGPKAPPAACGPQDTTPPAKPRIITSMAFDRAEEGSRVGNRNGGTRGFSPGTRDPLYIELGNVELGTRIELINLSAKPNASFSKEDTISLELTGRDPAQRRGAVYVTTEQMEKLGLKPGDMYQLRAVDPAGNASEPVTGELQPNEWANRDVIENGTWANVRGAQISALDGESERKTLIAKAVNDARPPMVLEAQLSISTQDDGQTAMVFDRAIEPGANVTVLNTRDGQSYSGTVDVNGHLTIPLAGLNDGDPMLVSVRDNNGIEGQAIEVVYSSKCKDGKAPSLKGGLGARLTGVI